jgi:hypothetical protein
MFERCMIGLHAGAVASLALIGGLSLIFGRDLELLALNHGAGPWLWLALWLGLALMIALARRALVAWRLGLGACSAALGASALVGWLSRAPLASEVGVSAAVLALACSALACGLGAGRVRHVRLERLPTSAAAAATSHAAVAAGAQRRASPPPSTVATLATVAAWAPFPIAFCTFFAWARGAGPLRDAGHVGMLLAFFGLLPGAALRRWFPRVSGLCFALTALGIAALAWRSGSLLAGFLAVAAGAGAARVVGRRAVGAAAEVLA